MGTEGIMLSAISQTEKEGIMLKLNQKKTKKGIMLSEVSQAAKDK